MKVYVVENDAYEVQDGSYHDLYICRTYDKAREVLLKESDWMRDPIMNVRDYKESQNEISGNNGKWWYYYRIKEYEVIE